MTVLPKFRTLAIPTPFAVGDVNLYLIEGSPLTLLDVGPNTPEAYNALVRQLKDCGYQISDIEQIIISHHHTDHVGLVQQVAEEANAPVIVHPYTKPFVESPKNARQWHDGFFQQVCIEGAVPDDMLSIINRTTHWIDRFVNAPATVARTINEGDHIWAGDIEWQVYYTPGHAGDLICLYHAATETLLASDHLILKISSNPLVEPSPIGGLRPRRLIEYIHHLERIAALRPQIAYSGHGQPITDVMGLVTERLALHQKRADRIHGYFADGPANLWQITEQMYGHIGQAEKFLALSEVLGHIDILENAGRLVRHNQDHIVFWQHN